MARAAFILAIRPDRVEEYVEAHADVWAEMRQAIADAGIRNYTIFIHQTSAFCYLEADDVERAFERLAETDVNARWQTEMGDLLELRVAEQGPELLTEIFRLVGTERRGDG